MRDLYAKEKDSMFVKTKPDVEVLYGQEPSIIYKWKKIIKIKNAKRRHKHIDKLLAILQKNTAKNSFITFDCPISSNNIAKYYINDPNLYYLFFDNLRCEYYKKDKVLNNSDSFDIFNAMVNTENEYFGRIDNFEQTNTLANDSLHPSICQLQGKGNIQFSELACVSHNLWICSGYHSYLIHSKHSRFGKRHSAHSFCLVDIYNNENLFLYDKYLGNFGPVPRKIVSDMLKGQPIHIDAKDQITVAGVYANADTDKI